MFIKLIITAYIALLACDFTVFANIDPYDYYPAQRYKLKNEIFRASRNLLDLNPLRPLVIKDKDGNVYYTDSSGNVMVTVDKEGNRSFALKGKRRHTRDKKGRKTKTFERIAGSSMMLVKNEFGEVIGKQEMGKGNKLIAEYDQDGNKLRSYQYDKYGKRIEWVVDELTQAKVKYGSDGKPLYEVDYEGNRLATYEYDKKGKLRIKTDIYGNVTYFNEDGNMTKTVAKEGYLIATFNYRKDEDGYLQLDFVKDDTTGNITYYKEGKQFEERDRNGNLLKIYSWQGTKLMYVEDVPDGSVTWYINAKPFYATRGGLLTKTWIYYEAKLMGIWDEESNVFDMYSHGQKTMELRFDDRPDAQFLLKTYEHYGIEI